MPCSLRDPESGKKWPKNEFWPHRQKGENMVEKREIWPKNGSKMAIFPFFGQFSHPFFGQFSAHFGPEARFAVDLYLGNRDRKSKVAKHIDTVSAALKKKCELLVSELQQAGLEPSNPKGGYFVWVKSKGKMTGPWMGDQLSDNWTRSTTTRSTDICNFLRPPSLNFSSGFFLPFSSFPV